MTAPPQIVVEARDELRVWLLDSVFPLWWEVGADLEKGGFHDRLTTEGQPLPGAKRARVQARQTFCYAAAPYIGWRGPWRTAMRHGMAFLDSAHLRTDGLFQAWEFGGGRGDAVDLYDQAFVLLALSSTYVQGELSAAQRAEHLIAKLRVEPAGGFADFNSVALRANPNMHMFESCLAWIVAGVEAPWRAAAAGQARLAMDRLVDPHSGALSEIFGPGWSAPQLATDRLVEPGHQFEWAWLLMRWSAISGDSAALAAGLRLLDVGERKGVDAQRNLAINALNGDLEPTDVGTRLWPQTERMRAALLAGELTGDDSYWDMAMKATHSLWRFLNRERPGLWRDSLEREDGTALASSFYHIVGAMNQLDRAVGT
jgi:mannose/cellobiose epimerase-like protein (N-acyl-D-glucosamine 2-epimerase family)